MSTLKAGNIQPQSNSDPLVFSTNATERMRIDTSGNIGIGTTSLTSNTKLDVRGVAHISSADTSTSIGSGNATAVITNTDTTTNNWSRLQFTDNYNFAGGVLIGAQCTDHTNRYYNFAINTKGTDGQVTRLFIDTSGNIGVGTGSPQAKLEVMSASAAKSYSTSVLDFSSMHLNGAYANTTNSALTFSSGGGGGAAISFRRDGTYGTYIDFWTNTNTSLTQFASFNRMTINHNGNVGIGTTLPVAKLDVRGTVSISDTGNFPTSSATLVYNRVHMGGTGPLLTLWNDGAAIALDGSSRYPYSRLGLGSRFSTSSTLLAGGYIDGGIEGTTDASGYLAFFTTPADGSADVEKMRITSDVVQMGDASPVGGAVTMVHGNAGAGSYNYPQVLNVYGTEYSSGSTTICFGCKPDTTAYGFVNTHTLSSIYRAVLKVGSLGRETGGGGIALYADSAARTLSTIGEDVDTNMTLCLKCDQSVFQYKGNTVVTADMIGTNRESVPVGGIFLVNLSNTYGAPTIGTAYSQTAFTKAANVYTWTNTGGGGLPTGTYKCTSYTTVASGINGTALFVRIT